MIFCWRSGHHVAFLPRETHRVSSLCTLQNPSSAWCGPPACQSKRTRRILMIQSTEEFLAALRAARRASTPLVSIRTADPASAIALTTRSLNGDADGTSLLSWDIMTGLSAVNGPRKKMLDSIIGERNPETVGPAEALSGAVKLADDANIVFVNP